jgi:UDPglucose 6-dehydrogenase
MQLYEVAEYWNQILKLNEFQSHRFCDNIVDTMVTIKGKKIAILGFAYKPGTSDTRESPAIAICNALIAEGCKVAICDPQVHTRCKACLLADWREKYHICMSFSYFRER